MTTGLTRLTELALRPILTFIAAADPAFARRMVVTSAVYGTVGSGPSEITVAHVLWRTKTVAVNTVIETRPHTALPSVAYVPLLTFTGVGSVCVVTVSVFVAVV